MPLHVSSTCAHHQEVKIVLYNIWYHHTYRWPSREQVVHETATYRCDDTRCCIIQFWPPDDEHMCSNNVEAWNKLIVKQKFCASSWLITEMHGHQNVKIYVTDNRLGCRVIVVRLPAGCRDRLSFEKFISCGVPSCFPQGTESDYTLRSVKITKEWSCTSSPSCVYMLSKLTIFCISMSK